MYNAPILIGGTGQIYQPSISAIGSISYSVIIGQSGGTLENLSSTLFCNITINTVSPISAQISAMVNCSPGQTLAYGATLNVCQGDIVSLSALPNSGCDNSYTYQWLVDGTVIATTQSIIVCNDVPDTHTYSVLIAYCCDIAIFTLCSIIVLVSPK